MRVRVRVKGEGEGEGWELMKNEAAIDLACHRHY
jgi:hypothetical protein